MPLSTAQQSSSHAPGERFGPFLFHPPLAIRRETTKHLVQSSTYPFNELADEFFYNVSDEDKQAVHGAREKQFRRAGVLMAGSIIYLEPGKPPTFFADAYAFLSGKEKDRARAVCIPGVGSSALGAVGLARDVATARDIPVAGVVAGYGLRELINDAMGGAFFFREINQLEFALESTKRGFSALVAALDLLPDIETYDSLGGGSTVQAMKMLIRDGRLPELEFLVGHSKGNLVLSGALSELYCEGADLGQLKKATIVLLSAVCALPNIGKGQVQIIGAIDALGWANSRLDIPGITVVPNAMHHLNRKIPLHLDAVAALHPL